MPSWPAFGPRKLTAYPPGLRVYLGWEVGNWTGEQDGLAAIIRKPSGQLVCLKPAEIAVERLFDRKAPSLDGLAVAADCGREFRKAERVVLGIGAPLGLPLGYQKAASSAIDAQVKSPKPGLPLLRNPLAFRLTDQFVTMHCGVNLDSPSLSARANTGSRARSLCGDIRRASNALVISPFQDDDPATSQFVAIETCPDVWLTPPLLAFETSLMWLMMQHEPAWCRRAYYMSVAAPYWSTWSRA